MLGAERTMIGTLLAHDPEADALLVAGRDLRNRQRYDSALAMFDRSLAAGGDKSRLQLERARSAAGARQIDSTPVRRIGAAWNK